MDKNTKNDPPLELRTTAPFKLKDKGKRSFQAVNLRKQFGFIPEVIIIEKVAGQNNVLRLSAVMTPQALAVEKEIVNNIAQK